MKQIYAGMNAMANLLKFTGAAGGNTASKHAGSKNARHYAIKKRKNRVRNKMAKMSRRANR